MVTTIPAPSGVTVFQGRATAATNLGATANTITPIPLGVEDVNDLGAHSNSTNPSRFTCKKAGLYSVVGALILASNATTVTAGNLGRVAMIYKNGAGVPGSSVWIPYVANSILTIQTFETLVPLALNDYIELVGSAGLANTMTYYDANHHSILRVDFIR